MKDSYRIYSIILFVSIVLITFFSTCSPLYPINPWDDANVFMTIGKSMLKGKILYRDIFDHKGPLLFFVHELAAALSSRSFLGIYLLEILCCFGFLAFSYRTMRLFAEHGISLITTCIVGVLTYSSDFMWYGDTVEEFSLPILLYILYNMLRYAKYSELPKKWESVLIGVGVAAIFWMKFTVLAMCVGALASLLFLACQRSQICVLLRCLAWIIAGIGGLTACVLLYFVTHNNMADLYQSYFIFNLCRYIDVDIYATLWYVYLTPLKWAVWTLLVGAMLLLPISRDMKLVVGACWATQLLAFVLFKVYIYYFLQVFVFAPLVIYFVRSVHSKYVIVTGATIFVILATATNYNIITLLTDNFPNAIIPLAEIVNTDKDSDKQVLTVKSYETGIYTLTDCLPPIKYFSTPNTYIKDLIVEQTAYLESCQSKYLIMKTDEPSYYSMFHPDLTVNYNLMCETSEQCRYEFILHPLQFMWSLGYMKDFIERFHTPEPRITYRLYGIK